MTARFLQQLTDSTPDTVVSVFTDIKRTFRTLFVPRLFATMGSHPHYLDVAWEIFKHSLALEQLDSKSRQRVALVTDLCEPGLMLPPSLLRDMGLGDREISMMTALLVLFQSFHTYAAMHG